MMVSLQLSMGENGEKAGVEEARREGDREGRQGLEHGAAEVEKRECRSGADR